MTLNCIAVNGDFANIFGNIHNAAKKTSEDLRKVLHVQTQDNNNAGNIVFMDSKEDDRIFVRTKATPITTQFTVPRGDNVDTTTQTVITSTTNRNTNGTNGKDGRENFTGGCAQGFQKTADGACKRKF